MHERNQTCTSDPVASAYCCRQGAAERAPRGHVLRDDPHLVEHVLGLPAPEGGLHGRVPEALLQVVHRERRRLVVAHRGVRRCNRHAAARRTAGQRAL